MIVETKSLNSLTKTEYRQCYSLNSRWNGTMQETLRLYYGRKYDAKVCLAKEDDILIGWALLYSDGRRIPNGHFYVRKTHRRRGVGKRLMSEALAVSPKIKVYPHDRRSGIFFAEYRRHIVTNKCDKYYIDEGLKIRKL